MLNPVNAEEIVEKLDLDLYPITIIKLLLNRNRLEVLFNKVESGEFPPNNKIDNSECSTCIYKNQQGIHACREHTSIFRILNSEKVLFDVDSGFYIVKNEIFKFCNNRMFIVYCPHTKLIPNYTDKEVRRIKPIVTELPESIPQYDLVKLDSSILLNSNLKCWFNHDFSIITIPNKPEPDFGLFCNK